MNHIAKWAIYYAFFLVLIFAAIVAATLPMGWSGGALGATVSLATILGQHRPSVNLEKPK